MLNLKEEAKRIFRMEQETVARGGDIHGPILEAAIMDAGGFGSVDIEPNQVAALFRQGALNSLPRLVDALEAEDDSTIIRDVCEDDFNDAIERLGGFDAVVELGIISPERMVAIQKKRWAMPSLCGDQ